MSYRKVLVISVLLLCMVVVLFLTFYNNYRHTIPVPRSLKNQVGKEKRDKKFKDSRVIIGSEILPDIWIGSSEYPYRNPIPNLVAILDVNPFQDIHPPTHENRRNRVEEMERLHLPLVSHWSCKEKQLAFRFLDKGLEKGGAIFIASQSGRRRAPAVLLPYLMERYHLSQQTATWMIQKQNLQFDVKAKVATAIFFSCNQALVSNPNKMYLE